MNPSATNLRSSAASPRGGEAQSVTNLCPSVAIRASAQGPSVTPLWPPESAAARYRTVASSTNRRYKTVDRTYTPLSMNVEPSNKSGPNTPAPDTPGPQREFFRLHSIKPRICSPSLHQIPDTKNPLIVRPPAPMLHCSIAPLLHRLPCSIAPLLHRLPCSIAPYLAP